MRSVISNYSNSMQIAAVFLFLTIFSTPSIGQPDVSIEGSGAGNEVLYVVNPSSGLPSLVVECGNIGITAAINESDDNWYDWAVYGFTNGSPSNNNGVVGWAEGTANGVNNFGVYGNANSEGNHNAINYAIYGEAGGPTDTVNNYAGFFNGNVVYTGTSHQLSDMRVKKNITGLVGGLNKVMALKPKSYDMRVDEFKDAVNLSHKHEFGLLAQDVESVIPELVEEVVVPSRLTSQDLKNKVKKESLKLKALDYTGLIPVMLAAMQEQQAQIDSLRAEISSQKK